MNTPEPIKDHPNATFVLGTTPLTTLVVWICLKLGLVMPQYVAAAVATICASALLVFRGALTKSAGAIWDLGIYGCCRRILRGRDCDPPHAE